MDLNLIKKLVKIFDSSDITDLEIEQEGFKVKIAKKIRSGSRWYPGRMSCFLLRVLKKRLQQSLPRKKQNQKLKTEVNHEIRSPIVGTFYRAPAPDADPYIQVGDIITKGSVLCIVEAMKLMNEIESDVDGRIIKILVDNGKPVEFNQPLFLVQT